ncbi:MAG TPA: UDP-glucose 4-epimerase GalE [Stellaceae bacterium]|nr:UDP-glucose 4-epimerase GalE [Stellaceae bacterium]
MTKTILVTGGAGYIGSHACKALAKAGYRPVAYDNLVYGHKESVRWGPFIEGDLGDGALLQSTMRRFDVAAVMHFAAFAYVGESMTAPEKYFRNNVVNSLTLLDTMKEVGVSNIVFSSSCATYGVPDTTPIAETAAQRPVNPYGETKLMIERVLHWYGVAHGIRHAALRYFNAAGADPEGEIGEDHEPETHLIPLILYAALGWRPHISIFGTDYPTPDGTALRDYIHVQDLAEAHVRAIQYLGEGGQSIAVNLGTGHGHSVREVIRAAERICGRPIPTQESPRRAGDPPVLVADPGRARTLLGWNARMSDLDTILATAWNWHKAHAQHHD